jgi:hypothetical protein
MPGLIRDTDDEMEVGVCLEPGIAPLRGTCGGEVERVPSSWTNSLTSLPIRFAPEVNDA